MRNLKSFFANLALTTVTVIITLAICFAIGEAYYRYKIGGISIDPPVEWFSFHGERGWSLVPGKYRYFHFTAFREVDVEINNFGTRNPPIALKPEKNRISIIGDSFTFADALNENEKFTSVTQRLSQGDDEIVNISVPGYGSGQQLMFLNELLDQGFDPGSKIVLVFFTNDILDNVGLDYGDLSRNPQKPAFFIDNGSLGHVEPVDPKAEKVAGTLKNRSLLARFLIQRAELLAARYPSLLSIASTFGYSPSLPRVPGVVNAWYTEGWEQRWEVTKFILTEIQNVTKNTTGNELAIVFIPSPLQVEPVFQRMLESIDGYRPVQVYKSNPNRPQNLLREFCIASGIEFIDTTDLLNPSNAGESTFFLREGHLNVRGSEIVGQRIYESMKGNTK